MSISLHSTEATDQDHELAGHDYRLREDQYRRTIEAGIIDEAEGVELRDGLLCVKPNSREPIAWTPYRLSLDQYRAMARAEILTTDDRIEFLEGWLVAKMSRYPPHTIAKGLTFVALRQMLPPGWFVAIEDPVTALDSEPEPDISIVRGSRRDYLTQAPGPQHVTLLVEVTDTSLWRDRSIKERLYARAGFPTYWIINLIDNRIEV